MNSEKSIKLINGGSYEDERGKIIYFNELDLTPVKRFYNIYHPNCQIIRAWQGHKQESKWFHVVKGSFKIVTIKPDDWIKPSLELVPTVNILNDKNAEVLYLPGGFATGIQAVEPDSILTVFSNLSTSDSKNDDYRFDRDLWYNWS
jgi:dTDP-4-dehydrorhamnose 3,5-epimerase-like enzyme